MGPFAGVPILSPDSEDDLEFDKVIVSANEGSVRVVEYRGS
jgi:hypothetical protein